MEWILLFFGLVIVGVLYIYKENKTEQKIKDLKNDFELRINALTETNNKLNETIESNKHQINLLTNTNLTLTQALNSERQQKIILNQTVEQLDSEIDGLNIQIEDINNKNAIELEKYNNEISKLGNQIEEIRESYTPFARLMRMIESTNHSFFITGKAGTGKSTFIQYLKTHSNKKIALVAPTGVAALNIGGRTIHSFFSIDQVDFVDDNLKKTINLSRGSQEYIKKLDVLVIDEISMVRPDILDTIDFILRKHRDPLSAFGGIQIVMVGDPYQLPPVITQNKIVKIVNYKDFVLENRTLQDVFSLIYGSEFFFDSGVFKELQNNRAIEFIELQTVYRQNDSNFINILNAVRIADKSNIDFSTLNKAVSDFTDDTICICPITADADKINNEKLSRIPKIEMLFDAELTGTYVNAIKENEYPVPKQLRLKDGAMVMIVKNMPDYGWVNGTIGKVIIKENDQLFVEVDGIKHQINKESWQDVKYTYDAEKRKVTTDIIGTFTQYPIQLAYVITVHKSQGKTFDSINIMAERFFADGQVYVALSRVRSLSGLHLSRPIGTAAIKVNQSVINFMDKTFAPRAIKLI